MSQSQDISDAVGERREDRLQAVRRGRVECIFTDDCELACQWLNQHDFDVLRQRVVTVRWHQLPLIDRAVEDVVLQLARVSTSLWPHWYGRFFDRETTADSLIEQVRSQANAPAMDGGWLRLAWKMAKCEQAPMVAGYGLQVSATQLAVTIDPDRALNFIFDLSVARDDPHVEAMARAAMWLADILNGRVVLVLPESLCGCRSLQFVDYASQTLRFLGQDSDALRDFEAAKAVKEKSGAPACFEIGPLIGQPHPQSPAEQRLAEVLFNDAELAGLFQFNQPLTFNPGGKILVDLLCESLRIVIEVDGFRYHCSQIMFASDRHRDFVLQTNDYLVLRLPSSLVLANCDEAIDRIRRCVEFRSVDWNSKIPGP